MTMFWDATYQHDRRKSRHRCQHCRRIINAGEQVFMAKVARHTTRAAHIECADAQVPEGCLTTRELMTLHATDHASKLGYVQPRAELVLGLERARRSAK